MVRPAATAYQEIDAASRPCNSHRHPPPVAGRRRASEARTLILFRRRPTSPLGILEPDYATCAAGKEQSPIDIKTRNVRHEKLSQLSFDYCASALHVINNGHTIEVDVPAGSTLNVGDHRYALVQFHFHRPSEETIDGQSSDMVAHFVHRDAEGHLAVVAVLLKSGAANPLLSAVWRYLPREEGGEARPSGVVIGPGELIPAARSYYMFPGSLTTPPCSEGVRWFVLKSSMTLSPEQLETFRELYPANARGTQPLNGRVVLSSG